MNKVIRIKYCDRCGSQVDWYKSDLSVHCFDLCKDCKKYFLGIITSECKTSPKDEQYFTPEEERQFAEKIMSKGGKE